MRILLCSMHGDALPLLTRLEEEGHDVAAYIAEPAYRGQYEGMVSHVLSPASWLAKGPKKDTLVIFDMVGLGALADRLTAAGWFVLGGSRLMDRLELDRAFGMKVLDAVRIRRPESWTARSLADARQITDREKRRRLVIKPFGNLSPRFTYVSDGHADLTAYLDYLERVTPKETEWLLQEVVKGVEVSIEGWFAKGSPVKPANSTIETKKRHAGDLGERTGCQSSVVWTWPMEGESTLWSRTVKKLLPLLKAQSYTGPLDLNCIIDEERHVPYGLELTARFGYNALWAFLGLWDRSKPSYRYGAILHALADGSLAEFYLSERVGACLRASLPEAGLLDCITDTKPLRATMAGKPVLGPLEDPGLWLLDVKASRDGQIVTAGSDGQVAECTGSGKTVSDATEGANRLFDRLRIPEKCGRRQDGFARAHHDLGRLKQMGYGEGLPEVSAAPTESNRRE